MTGVAPASRRDMRRRPDYRLGTARSLSDVWKGTWAQRLLWLAVALLPFQQAFTIDVGFPLKATEVLGVAGMALAVFQHRGGYLRRPEAWLIAALGAVIIVSSVWVLLTTDGTITSDAYPRGLTTDLILYTGYAGLALVMCLVLARAMTPALLAGAIGIAVRLAAIYAAAQMLLWVANSEILAHVNGAVQLGSLYGERLPRNGSFLEGNYLGFFASVALFFLLRARDRVGAALAICLVLYSASTTSLLGIGVAIVAIIVLRPTWPKVIAAGIVAAVGAVLTFVVPALNWFVSGQLIKLGLLPNDRGPAYTYSLRDRTVGTETGFSIANGHPVFGVGQGRYALHYWDYINMAGLPDHYGYFFNRPIANNAYAQIGAETGYIALAVFVALIVYLLLKARHDSDTIVGMVTALAFGLWAYPAWTVLVPWALIAAIATVIARSDDPWRRWKTTKQPPTPIVT